MRALLTCFILATFLATSVQSQAPPGQPPEVAQWSTTDGTPLDLDSPDILTALETVRDQLSGQAIHDCVFDITTDGANSYRVMGTPTQDMFVEKYKTVFSNLGLPSALHHFPGGGPLVGGQLPEQLRGGTNIIGVLPGLDLTQWVVLGAHFDTRELTLGGGALDNAAGLCSVLELAGAFKSYTDANGPLAASVVFIWYDGEEWGLYGSVAFSKDTHVAAELLGLDEAVVPTILVSQSYDMPGLNYPAKNMWVQYGDPNNLDEYAVLNLRTAPIHLDEPWACWNYGCYEDLKDRDDIDAIIRRNANYQFLVREIAYDLLSCPPDFCWVYDDHYGRSDHIPLIALGAAGMRIQGSHDQEYPNYHQPTDSLPGLYAITGGLPAGIISGFQMEVRAGGLPAFYVGLTGNFSQYGDVHFFGEPTNPDAATTRSNEARDSPSLPLGATILAFVLISVLFRHSRKPQEPGRLN